MNKRLALGLMVACLLFAAVLRIPALTEKPPGLHYDEAANGILAGDIGLRGERPLFITSYTGKEVFFFYLAGILMRFLGESVFSLRLAAVFLGLLTVAATYRSGYELLRDRRIAVIAAGLLAVSFWHLLFSRLGFRAISQPLMQALAVAALFHGFRHNSRISIIGGGIAFGLTAYTYLAGRIFPVVLLLALIPFIFSREQRRLRLQQLALFFGLGLLIALPLMVFFIGEPNAFWVRIDQVLPADLSLASYLESYGKTLGIFFILGDPYWRFNIPGKPLFNWLWGALAVIGWLALIIRLVRQSSPIIRSACLLLVLTPLLLILPSALAVEEIVPSNLRAIGLLPFIYLLPGIGVLLILQAVQYPVNELFRRLPPDLLAGRRPTALPQYWATRPVTIAVGVLLILIIGGVTAWNTYFRQWSTRSDLYYDSDADLAAVADFLNQRESGESSIYVSALHYRHPTLAFLSERYEEIKWLPESQVLVIPAALPATYIYPASSPLPDWAAAYLPDHSEANGPPGPDGRPTFVSYQLRNQQPEIDFAYDSSVNFGDYIVLKGYEYNPGKAGEVLNVDLLWQIDAVPDKNYLPFIHLEDAWGYRWSQAEPFAYPPEQWLEGDRIIQRVELPLPPGMPRGLYQLRIGFFDPDSQERLPVLDDAGRYGGNAWTIENVFIDSRKVPQNPPLPALTTNLQAAPNLKLLGYERSAETVEAGTDVPIALWWESSGPLNPMTLRFELINSVNRGQILTNTQPVHGTVPFEEWTGAQYLIDHQDIPISESTPAGEYRLGLRVLNSADETIATADLGGLTVEESQRLYKPPKIRFPQAAVFGNEIQLTGYDLSSAGPREFGLELVWKALREPANDYTVFVHVLNPDGSCCIWQDDSWPQQGKRPTGGWLSGEYVVDSYAISLPEDLEAGNYPIEIGLYLAGNGQRLVVEVPRLSESDALLLRMLEIE